MANWSMAQMRALALLLSALVVCLVVGVARRGPEAEAELTIVGQPRPNRVETPIAPAVAPPQPAEIVIHVAGAVKKPGVYHLQPGARVEDALKAAGGPQEKADLDAINLAAHAEDGAQLRIPVRGQSPLPDTVPASPAGASSVRRPAARGADSGHAGAAAKFTRPGMDSVDINAASADALERLPGVGPAIAARIVDHRKQNGRFTQAEQLMDVPGIGERKFAKMKPYVRVR